MRLLLFSTLFLTSVTAQAATITFEGLPSGECGGIPSTLNTGGYTFSYSRILCINTANPTGNSFRFASNGTQTLGLVDFPAGGFFALQQSPNGPFDFLSFDAAKFFRAGDFAFGANAKELTVRGTKQNGNIVLATFNLTIVPDGVGGAPDFHTFTLPATFNNLSVVQFASTPSTPGGTAYYMMDNLNLVPFSIPVAVPEPGSAALLISGMLLLPLAKRRRS